MLEGVRGEDSIAELCRREGISQGLYYKWSKDFMEAGKKRLAGGTSRAANSDEEPPALLHPGLAEVYRAKVADLSNALKVDETRAEATQIVRGLLASIRLIPEGDSLAIELEGELAGLLTLRQKNRPEAVYPGRFCNAGCGGQI